MVRTSYLRVYQPVSRFSDGERGQWANAAGEEESPDAAASRKWLIAGALPARESLEAGSGAFVREIGGETFVCPWRTRLRMLASLLAFRGSVPAEVADAFVPEAQARRAASELAALGEADPDIRSHILHANWHVPLRWFAAFHDSERILTEDKSGLRVRYETRVADARTRLDRAIAILETSYDDGDIIDALRELSGWLDGFADESVLELDYGSVAKDFEDDDLVEDRSAQAVWCCLEALQEGDMLRAGRLFMELTERWSAVKALEVLN